MKKYDQAVFFAVSHRHTLTDVGCDVDDDELVVSCSIELTDECAD